MVENNFSVNKPSGQSPPTITSAPEEQSTGKSAVATSAKAEKGRRRNLGSLKARYFLGNIKRFFRIGGSGSARPNNNPAINSLIRGRFNRTSFLHALSNTPAGSANDLNTLSDSDLYRVARRLHSDSVGHLENGLAKELSQESLNLSAVKDSSGTPRKTDEADRERLLLTAKKFGQEERVGRTLDRKAQRQQMTKEDLLTQARNSGMEREVGAILKNMEELEQLASMPKEKYAEMLEHISSTAQRTPVEAAMAEHISELREKSAYLLKQRGFSFPEKHDAAGKHKTMPDSVAKDLERFRNDLDRHTCAGHGSLVGRFQNDLIGLMNNSLTSANKAELPDGSMAPVTEEFLLKMADMEIYLDGEPLFYADELEKLSSADTAEEASALMREKIGLFTSYFGNKSAALKASAALAPSHIEHATGFLSELSNGLVDTGMFVEDAKTIATATPHITIHLSKDSQSNIHATSRASANIGHLTAQSGKKHDVNTEQSSLNVTLNHTNHATGSWNLDGGQYGFQIVRRVP